MRKSSLFVTCALLLSLAASPAVLAGELSAQQVAENIQKLYEKTRDFKAAFKQVYKSEALGRTKTSSGFVYVKKPGMMRWDYRDPRPKNFVADGSALFIYDPELEQVMIDRSFSGSDLSTAVTFLWGRGKLSEEFKVAFSKRTDIGDAKHFRLELTPKKKARFKKLWFVVERKGFRVVETLIEDPGGNLNHIYFSKMASNVGLKDNAFKFEIPKGIEVIEAPKQK